MPHGPAQFCLETMSRVHRTERFSRMAGDVESLGSTGICCECSLASRSADASPAYVPLPSLRARIPVGDALSKPRRVRQTLELPEQHPRKLSQRDLEAGAVSLRSDLYSTLA